MVFVARELLLARTRMTGFQSKSSGKLFIRPKRLALLLGVSSSLLLALGQLGAAQKDERAWEYGSSPRSLPATTENPWGFWQPTQGSLDLSYPEISAVLRQKMPRRTRPEVVEALSAQILRLCKQLGFQPSFILAVIEHESAFRPRAQSPRNAMGLMQLLPTTAAEVARRTGFKPTLRRGRPWLDLRDPVLNVTLGMHYLAQLKTQFQTLEGTLAAYNLGPGRWAELLAEPERIRPNQTFKYVALIQRTSRDLKVDARIAWEPRLASRGTGRKPRKSLL